MMEFRYPKGIVPWAQRQQEEQYLAKLLLLQMIPTTKFLVVGLTYLSNHATEGFSWLRRNHPVLGTTLASWYHCNCIAIGWHKRRNNTDQLRRHGGHAWPLAAIGTYTPWTGTQLGGHPSHPTEVWMDIQISICSDIEWSKFSIFGLSIIGCRPRPKGRAH